MRSRLSYDEANGSLYWLPRLPETVNATGFKQGAICKNWNARFAGKEAFTAMSLRGYYVASINGRRVYKHHVIWAMHYGEWPDSMIDHMDGDPTNNHISNLRLVSRAENQRNMKLQDRNKTGRIGVWHDKRRNAYQAFISHKNKRISLGRFKRIEDAIAARSAAEIKYGYHPNHGRSKA